MSCKEASGEDTTKRRCTVDHTSAVKLLATELEELIVVLNGELDKSWDDNFDVNYRNIVESKIGRLGSGIGLYARCFQELAVSNRQEMDHLLKDQFCHKEMREAVDDLLVCEDRWNDLLDRMEEVVNNHETKSKTVLKVPLDTVIYEGDKERNIGLVGEHKKRILLILLRHLA